MIEKKLLPALGLLACLSGCTLSEKNGTAARDAVSGYYESHIRALNDGEFGVVDHFSPGFEKLMRESDFFLDWDPWLMAQDWDDPKIAVAGVSGSNARPVVTVSITDLGSERTTDVCLVKGNGTYLIDNFVTETYDLRALLAGEGD